MKKTLYLECYSGISGDMFVAAMLDLGASEKGLMKALHSIPAEGFEVIIKKVKKSGIECTDFDVILDHDNHDHDMDYLYGEIDEHKHHHEHHQHHHGHEHHEHHHHAHGHNHDNHHHHHHEHRGFYDIKKIIEKTDMSQSAKDIAVDVFRIIAKAESKAHGEPFEKVHFHEVGALDSIADVIAAAYCIDDLGIEKTVIPFLKEGYGTVRCQHGVLPVPVPAVLNIAEANGLSLKITDDFGEYVTPTGAAIAAKLITDTKLPESFRIVKTGLGAGKRDYEKPSILRAMLIEPDDAKSDLITRLETNIDDSTGEQLGYVMERLFEKGARDVHFIPVLMKKNRPGYELVLICDEDRVKTMENIIFTETTSIGIRRMKMERTVLERENVPVNSIYGEIMMKKCTLPDGSYRLYPEYESVVEICKKTGRPFEEIIKNIKLEEE